MSRKRILWLCSWYPNRMEPFNGDFIQRHANAAALHNDIYVIHVAGDTSASMVTTEHHLNQTEDLTEHIVYYKKPVSFLKRFRNYYRWSQVYKKAVQKYIAENGKPDMLHVHVPMNAGLIANRVYKNTGIPFVVTEHWTIYQPQNLVKYQKHNILFKSALRHIIKGCRLLLPVSRDLGELINKLVIQKEYTVVENVANVNHFYYAAEAKQEKSFRFLHVSNMTYQKNVEGIIESFVEFNKSNPDPELVFIGSIPDEMRNKVEKTGLLYKKIFLKGEVPYTEVAKEMQQADALVMFSRFENSPCSIIEALCCGLPVIATSVGGIPELINDSNGILIESLDKKAMVESLVSVITGYSNYDRNKIAEVAKSKFSYPVIGKKLDEIYSSVISGMN